MTGAPVVAIDLWEWRLTIDGPVAEPLLLTYDDVLSLSAQTTKQTIDCTSGWYSLQEWSGVPMARLLDAVGGLGAAGVRLVSATGYKHTFPMPEARTILLATHVSGEVLDARHGFPLRAVVPDRRGWFWVKWLVKVDVLQSHAEVVGGILSATREVVCQL